MSYCKQEGKDRILFITREDHEKPSTVSLPDDEEQPGIILPNGEINWNCPCLGGMATGPCGVEFRDAFSCFQYSTATPKGSDCFGQFHTMQECMTQYPSLYPQPDPIRDDIEDELDGEEAADSSLPAAIINNGPDGSKGASSAEQQTKRPSK